jgi:hypothetical protein
MKRIILGVLGVVAVLLVICVIRALTYGSGGTQVDLIELPKPPMIDANVAARHYLRPYR